MTASTSSTFDRRREEFPTLASGIHLLSHSLGPVPRAAREAMLAYTDVWEAQQRLGARVHIVPSDDGIVVPLERILEAIDETTCLVALSHTSYRSSYRVDARAIVERAHALGALVLLDTYQSAGVLELKAAEWGADFLIGGTIKWLCGGPACGYLYVRPELQGELRPRLTGWVAHGEA